MKDLLLDLAAHAQWADAITFHALAKCPAALTEADVVERLHHTSWVAGAFGRLLIGEEPGMPSSEIPPFESLRSNTKASGQALTQWLIKTSEEDLERTIHIPWFPDPPCHIRAREALMQALLHSQHHRGQTMTRLNQMGGKSKNVDFIIWLWKGRPEARWE